MISIEIIFPLLDGSRSIPMERHVPSIGETFFFLTFFSYVFIVIFSLPPWALCLWIFQGFATYVIFGLDPHHGYDIWWIAPLNRYTHGPCHRSHTGPTVWRCVPTPPHGPKASPNWIRSTNCDSFLHSWFSQALK